MKKYVFKSYNPRFPSLFFHEKERIALHFPTACRIEHVGSTSVPGLGGKGIIDIAIAVSPENMEIAKQYLMTIGYEFRPQFSTPDRLYLIIYLPDPEEETRRYHVHLTYPESKDWQDFLRFRNYLREHPEKAAQYADLKQKAADTANQDGKIYRELKDTFFKKHL